MANIQYYDVILKPVITEKSMELMADKKYTFLVHTEATKSQVKEAVEKMFAGTKVKCQHNEHGRKDKKTWYDIWKNSENKESNCTVDRRKCRYRNLRRTVRSNVIRIKA